MDTSNYCEPRRRSSTSTLRFPGLPHIHMCDEEAYLYVKEEEIRASSPALAHQIQVHHMEKGCYIEHHMTVLNNITSLQGYTSSTLFGVRLQATPLPTSPSSAMPVPGIVAPIPEAMREDFSLATELDADFEDEQVGEDEETAILRALFNVFKLLVDACSI
jgi:hypothetical protein